MQNDSFYVTDTDTTNTINKLKSNKSKDPFEIKAGHFTSITSNPFLIEHLTKMMNNIFVDDTFDHPCDQIDKERASTTQITTVTSALYLLLLGSETEDD